MASLGFRLRAGSAQNEPPASFIEHLRRAGPLLAIEITIKADPQKARPILGLIGQETPRHLAGLVKEGVEQIPGARSLGLRLTIALTFYFSRNFRCIIPRVRPDNLRRNIEVQRLGLEEVTEVQRVVAVVIIFRTFDLLLALGVHELFDEGHRKGVRRSRPVSHCFL